jgi:hypothetical protein
VAEHLTGGTGGVEAVAAHGACCFGNHGHLANFLVSTFFLIV